MSRFLLRSVRVENYRCFEALELSLEDDTTVLFAENGGGKTALLDALAMGLAAYQRGVPRTLRLDAERDPRMVALDEGARREPAGRCGILRSVSANRVSGAPASPSVTCSATWLAAPPRSSFWRSSLSSHPKTFEPARPTRPNETVEQSACRRLDWCAFSSTIPRPRVKSSA